MLDSRFRGNDIGGGGNDIGGGGNDKNRKYEIASELCSQWHGESDGKNFVEIIN